MKRASFTFGVSIGGREGGRKEESSPWAWNPRLEVRKKLRNESRANEISS
jgi:hypothetical protein